VWWRWCLYAYVFAVVGCVHHLCIGRVVVVVVVVAVGVAVGAVVAVGVVGAECVNDNVGDCVVVVGGGYCVDFVVVVVDVGSESVVCSVLYVSAVIVGVERFHRVVVVGGVVGVVGVGVFAAVDAAVAVGGVVNVVGVVVADVVVVFVAAVFVAVLGVGVLVAVAVVVCVAVVVVVVIAVDVVAVVAVAAAAVVGVVVVVLVVVLGVVVVRRHTPSFAHQTHRQHETEMVPLVSLPLAVWWLSSLSVSNSHPQTNNYSLLRMCVRIQHVCMVTVGVCIYSCIQHA